MFHGPLPLAKTARKVFLSLIEHRDNYLVHIFVGFVFVLLYILEVVKRQVNIFKQHS